MNPVIGLALLLLGATSPGTPITLNATCTYTTNAASAAMTASKCIAVISPVSSELGSPVYLTSGYKRVVKAANGTLTQRLDHLADGLTVRFLHKADNGSYVMMEGIQLSDGRVLVDGVPVDRND